MHIFIIAIIIVIILVLLNKEIGDILNIPKSKVAYAKVILKQPSGRISHINAGNVTLYRITFEIDDQLAGKTLILPVSRKIHESVSEGSSGVLVIY